MHQLITLPYNRERQAEKRQEGVKGCSAVVFSTIQRMVAAAWQCTMYLPMYPNHPSGHGAKVTSWTAHPQHRTHTHSHTPRVQGGSVSAQAKAGGYREAPKKHPKLGFEPKTFPQWGDRFKTWCQLGGLTGEKEIQKKWPQDCYAHADLRKELGERLISKNHEMNLRVVQLATKEEGNGAENVQTGGTG